MKYLTAAAVIATLLATSVYLFRVDILMAMVAFYIEPEEDFAAQQPPPPPNYEEAQYWAALPERVDAGDQLPAGVTRNLTGVAVFFIHPTSNFSKTWNQPLQDKSANWIVDERVLRHQASVFNSCCDIYAPRYRQATIYSFLDDANGEQALQFAYGDVASAFHSFLNRVAPEQPFIIAGHSQGARHATQLVREMVTGTPLQQRLVAAYLVGFSITYGQLGGLPACDEAGQFGCALGWNAVEGDHPGLWSDPDLLCTNPLNWRDRGGYAGHDRNRGAIGYPDYTKPLEAEDISRMELERGIADAECLADGRLAVHELRSASFPWRMPGNSLHVYDYSLFHTNIRENVAERIQAYMDQRNSSSSSG
jgi:pimeloyl-ACP methyl ester carboxylesterase